MFCLLVWELCHGVSISAIMAALVTELAQCHVQQCVAALVEEAEADRGGHASLPNIVKTL